MQTTWPMPRGERQRERRCMVCSAETTMPYILLFMREGECERIEDDYMWVRRYWESRLVVRGPAGAPPKCRGIFTFHFSVPSRT
jgi:hypothetical protein